MARNIKHPQHLFLFGHYGKGNAGDDAMLLSLLRYITGLAPGTQYWVLAGPLLRLAADLASHVSRVPYRLVQVLSRMFSCDAVVLGGGTHFIEDGRRLRDLRQLSKLTAVVLLARLFGKPVYFVATGIGPLKTPWGRFLTRVAHNTALASTVRDRLSMARLEEIGTHRDRVCQCFDLSVLLSVPTGLSRGRAAVVLGVSILPVNGIYRNRPSEDLHAIRSLARALDAWLSADASRQVRLFELRSTSTEEGGDRTAVRSLYNHIDRKSQVMVREYDSDPIELLGQIAECTHFLTMRFHAAVFAYLAGLPMIMVDYLGKCRPLAVEIGLPETAILTYDALPNTDLLPLLNELITDPQAFQARLPLTVAREGARRSVPEALAIKLTGGSLTATPIGEDEDS